MSTTSSSETEKPCSLVFVYGNGGRYQIWDAITDGRYLKTKEPPILSIRRDLPVTGAYTVIDGKTFNIYRGHDMEVAIRSGLFTVLEEVSPITVPGHHGREARRQLENMGAYMILPTPVARLA